MRKKIEGKLTHEKKHDEKEFMRKRKEVIE